MLGFWLFVGINTRSQERILAIGDPPSEYLLPVFHNNLLDKSNFKMLRYYILKMSSVSSQEENTQMIHGRDETCNIFRPSQKSLGLEGICSWVLINTLDQYFNETWPMPQLTLDQHLNRYLIQQWVKSRLIFADMPSSVNWYNHMILSTLSWLLTDGRSVPI